jgi:hypothetical protein
VAIFIEQSCLARALLHALWLGNTSAEEFVNRQGNPGKPTLCHDSDEERASSAQRLHMKLRKKYNKTNCAALTAPKPSFTCNRGRLKRAGPAQDFIFGAIFLFQIYSGGNRYGPA